MVPSKLGKATSTKAFADLIKQASISKGSWYKSDASHKISREDVVSEKLCDDVIKYLAPTLEKHRGCTLIDLQPGACLFSSRLHDFLKPERHILAEPDDFYFDPFIKPLLDQPRSTYRYTKLELSYDSWYRDEFSRILKDPELLPARPQLPPGSMRLKTFDPSVLIIGNLSRDPRSRKSDKISQTAFILRRFAQDVLANQYFQRSGLLRMLLWVPEMYKSLILGAVPNNRSGFNASLDMGMQVSEVTSVQSLDSLYQYRDFRLRRTRFSALDELADKATQERMQKSGISPVEGRDVELLSTVDPPSTNQSPILSPIRSNLRTLEEITAKIDELSSRIQNPPSFFSKRSLIGLNPASVEYAHGPIAVEQALTQVYTGSSQVRTGYILDLELTLVNLEANFKDFEETNPDPATLEALRGKMKDLDEHFSRLLKRVALLSKKHKQFILDDLLSYHQSPSVLPVFKRPFHPLKALKTEFWPEQSLTLLDIMPKSRDLALPGLASSEETTKFCGELLHSLFAWKSWPLPDVLDKIAVGASKDLIPKVPAITDARKGGRFNPNRLRVRMVTEEMIEGLVKAFFEWPFRPTSGELALANERSHELRKQHKGDYRDA